MDVADPVDTATFPDGFWWGSGASSTQCEGAAPASDWLAWEQAGQAPASGDGNGFATRYAEDFAALAALGLTHHRLSIEWARIEPEPGRRDTEAIEHYLEVLRTARAAGIEPWVTLHHFTLPGWFAVDEKGFVDPHARTLLLAAPRRLHGRDLRRPRVRLEAGQRTVGLRAARLAAAACSRRACPTPSGSPRRSRRSTSPPSTPRCDSARPASRSRRSTTSRRWSPPSRCPTSRSPRDRLDHVQYGVWVDAVRDGILHVPGRAPIERDRVPRGLRPDRVLVLQRAVDRPERPHRRLPGRRPARPDGLRAVERGPRPAAAPAGRGPARPAAPRLRARHRHRRRRLARGVPARSRSASWPRRVADGIDLRGFFHWTAVDNYEWTYGYSVPFGLFEQDRTPKPSTALMRSWATSTR